MFRIFNACRYSRVMYLLNRPFGVKVTECSGSKRIGAIYKRNALPQKVDRSSFSTHPKAFLSVANKEGIVPFAKWLHQKGFFLVATDETAKLLKENNIQVQTQEEFTGVAKGTDESISALCQQLRLGLKDSGDPRKFIKLVVSNFSPYSGIHYGGYYATRMGFQNFQRVTLVTNPKQYQRVRNFFEDYCLNAKSLAEGKLENFNRSLGIEAFKTTKCCYHEGLETMPKLFNKYLDKK